MQQMDMASIALLAVSGYVAVLALVRLMTLRRDSLIERFREEVEREKERKKEQQKKEMVHQLRRQRSA
jgi:type II secretory pathway component PulK